MKVNWTNATPGCVTTMMLPNGRQVALYYGDNEVSQEIYDDLIKYVVIKAKSTPNTLIEAPPLRACTEGYKGKEEKSKHKEID